jgi:hypothetical protein
MPDAGKLLKARIRHPHGRHVLPDDPEVMARLVFDGASPDRRKLASLRLMSAALTAYCVPEVIQEKRGDPGYQCPPGPFARSVAKEAPAAREGLSREPPNPHEAIPQDVLRGFLGLRGRRNVQRQSGHDQGYRCGVQVHHAARIKTGKPRPALVRTGSVLVGLICHATHRKRRTAG